MLVAKKNNHQREAQEETELKTTTTKKRTDGGRLFKGSGPKINNDGQTKIGGSFTLSPNPAFLETRMNVFDRISARQKAEIAGKIIFVLLLMF